MSEHLLTQPQRTNTPQEATRDALSLQYRHTNQAEPTTLPRLLFDVAPGIFAEPRIGYDFSLVPAHTEMVRQIQPLLRTGTMVQRYPVNGDVDSAPCATCSEESTSISASGEPVIGSASPAPEAATTTATTEPEEESAAPEETMTSTFLVEDSATELAPGQMRKSDFLAQLRAEVTRTAEAAMAGTGRTTADCPYLDYWFDYYSAQDVRHGERALRRYVPEASSATSAGDYIPIVVNRVRQSVETWVRTGEVSGVPEGVSAGLPGEIPAGSSGSAPATGGPVMAKARDGGVRSTSNPQTIQAELGEGQPLDSGVRSRMESAFGMDFSQVRTHTDTTAAELSNRFNARAFTVGEHVAFGSGEYRPGTLVGDALIAHEMAHVVQQSGTSDSVAPMQTGNTGYNMLENDADKSAIEAVVSLLGIAKKGLSNIVRNTIPQLRSGLRLSRCSRGTAGPTPRSLRHISTDHNPDATWGYVTYVTYEVLDDRGNPIRGFDVNEKFGTPAYDYPGADWRQSRQGGYTSLTTQFSDMIQGETNTHTPRPQNPQSPLGSTKVQHWTQDWYIGSTTPGRGTKVQTNTFQKYRDHADHENITSPT